MTEFVSQSRSTGTSTFRLTSSSINDQTGTDRYTTTAGEKGFYSQGSLDTVQEQTLSIRNADVDFQELTETRTIQTVRSNYHDPLAQTFMVDEDTGIFVTKVDVFFQTKDGGSIPVWCQLRETTLGTPNSRILPFSEIELYPDDIETSGDGTVATSWVFDAPIYLEPNTEYAFIMGSSSTEYRVFISQLGEVELTTANQEFGQILVNAQPLLGSLFKSQNATV